MFVNESDSLEVSGTEVLRVGDSFSSDREAVPLSDTDFIFDRLDDRVILRDRELREVVLVVL